MFGRNFNSWRSALQRPLHKVDKRLGKKRLLDRRHDVFEARSRRVHFSHMAGHHQNRHVRRALILQEPAANFVSVEIRQAVIKQDEIREDAFHLLAAARSRWKQGVICQSGCSVASTSSTKISNISVSSITTIFCAISASRASLGGVPRRGIRSSTVPAVVMAQRFQKNIRPGPVDRPVSEGILFPSLRRAARTR